MRNRKSFTFNASHKFHQQIKKLNQFKKSPLPPFTALKQQKRQTEPCSPADSPDLFSQCDKAVAESKALADEIFRRYFGRSATEQIALWESQNDADFLAVRRELKMAELSYNLAKAKRMERGEDDRASDLKAKQGDFYEENRYDLRGISEGFDL